MFKFSPARIPGLILAVTICSFTPAPAQEAVSLMKPGEPAMGWTFINGQEFPGAKGGLQVDVAQKHNGQESLEMTADFTGGGVYVQAAAAVEGVDIREFSVWLKNFQQDQITLRFVDGSGRCHQFSLRTEPSEGWQRLVFPLEQFFSRKGDSNAIPMVAKYEAWGGPEGAPSGAWTGPAKSVGIVLTNHPDQPTTTIWINGATLIPRPMETAATKDSGVPETIALDEVIDGEHFWQFHDGREFPGAKGGLAAVAEESAASKNALKLTGDFTGGGVYVTAIKNLEEYGWQDLKAIRLRIKSEGAETIGIRLGDGSGQIHQKKGLPILADGKWHDLVLRPADIAGGEHWGGANDGRWHGTPKILSIALENSGGKNALQTLLLADIQADALLAGKSGTVAWQEGFEAEGTEPVGWTLKGSGKIDSTEAFKGSRSLVLEKTEKTLGDLITATGPTFPAAPGILELQFAARSDLESMDNSYNGSVGVEFLDVSGHSLGQLDLVTLFRKNAWKPEKKQVEVPAGTASARFVARINKETPGKFWVDELSSAIVVGTRKDDRIRRMMFSTARVGNLLLPEDPQIVTVEVWATKPLPEDQRKLSLTVKDYWGAEQSAPLTAELQRDGRVNELFRYIAKVDLKSVPLEVGRYYEIHGAISRKDSEPFGNFSSLAILPEAPANSYKADEVPFTSRNWDNRLGDYVDLTKRLGIRICGIWGKMEADSAKLEAPQLDRVKDLGMGFLTGSPAHHVEQRLPGWEELLANDGEKIRLGVRNFIEKYGSVRPMVVNLGNEPHSKGEEVKVNVEAYRMVYQEIKKIDPNIVVVATSAGIQEDYFKYGFGEWCDAYDFHVYEDALSVRKIVQEKFPEMFKKYGHPKPVWSTELGLNSQGMARQFVAAELYRKFANFFAGGGANVSWFGLLYPDAEGTNADSFGAAHNVFDSRYARYAPKLDAIAYYNAVNAIGIKKFAQDKVYGDIRAFLFRDRDNRGLQIWYKDKGREDIFIPLPGVDAVQVVRIDGTLRSLDAGGKGVTLTVSEDPVLLLFEGGEKTLPARPSAPAILLANAASSLLRGEPNTFDVVLDNTKPDQVSLLTPPLWKAKDETVKNAAGNPVKRFTVEVPENSTAREVDLTIQLKDAAGKTSGEIYYRPTVTGAISLQVLPVPTTENQPPAVRLVVQNNSPAKQQVTWDVSLLGEQDLKEGAFAPPEPSSAYFADTPSGLLDLEGKQSREIILPLSEADLYKVYRLRAVVRDINGRVTTQERPISAFYGVPKVKVAPVIDGGLDDPAWKAAPVRKLDNAGQFFAFPAKDTPQADWKGLEDLSAEIRYLWDDAYFYVSVKVKDDIAGKILQQDGQLWQQDGLQFLIDPMRTSDRKIGKYEYSIGEGTKGPQTWCTLSADGAAPAGDVPAVRLAIKREAGGTGGLTYEMAIPWARLAPFQPVAGADLGFTLIINEDDGHGRDSFMTWFGNAHSKDIDTVGDLILED